jgi:hypothetical protein
MSTDCYQGKPERDGEENCAPENTPTVPSSPGIEGCHEKGNNPGNNEYHLPDRVDISENPRSFSAMERFLNALTDRLNSFVATLARYTPRVESMFKGLLLFTERAQRWVVETTIRVKEYLRTLGKVLGSLCLALLKLSLFYVPSLLLVMFFGFKHWMPLLLALFWALFVTAIGLTYGKADEPQEPSEEARNSTREDD